MICVSAPGDRGRRREEDHVRRPASALAAQALCPIRQCIGHGLALALRLTLGCVPADTSFLILHVLSLCPNHRYKGVTMGYSIILSSYITVAVAGAPCSMCFCTPVRDGLRVPAPGCGMGVLVSTIAGIAHFFLKMYSLLLQPCLHLGPHYERWHGLVSVTLDFGEPPHYSSGSGGMWVYQVHLAHRVQGTGLLAGAWRPSWCPRSLSQLA